MVERPAEGSGVVARRDDDAEPRARGRLRGRGPRHGAGAAGDGAAQDEARAISHTLNQMNPATDTVESTT